MSRIMNFSRDLVGVLASPEETLSRVRELGVENQGLYLYVFFSAFLGYMMGGLISAITGAGIMVPVLLALVGLVVSFIKLIVWAIISHIIATVVFEGKGTFAGTLKMMGFSAAPFVVGIFALLTMTLLGTFFTSSMLFVVMYIWTVMIAAAAVAAEHEMGYGKAFLSVFALPAIIITLLMMLAGAL